MKVGPVVRPWLFEKDDNARGSPMRRRGELDVEPVVAMISMTNLTCTLYHY